MNDISAKTPSIRDDDGFGVVAIGASAGGLNACERLIAALPVTTGMAFILVQHLEPTHRSLMAGLLASHTKMAVSEAAEGMVVEPDHLYVIPPATYLSVSDGRLRLSPPKARRGARLPFDFLLHSVAKEFGPRATCVVLSGTGRDGSTGLRSVVDQGGRVFAQDPREAEYDGMPRSAIDTGAKVVVLPAARLAEAVVEKKDVPFQGHTQKDRGARGPEDGALGGIIELLRANTPHDFRNYKSGTLERRIQRRMGLANIAQTDMAQYVERLRTDAGERDALGQDLLINVTAFFRDPKVYAFLSEQVVPALIAERSSDRPVRLWIAGCSTGEEAYSLTMLFQERIAADKLGVKLQVFASDIDAEAVATAREGLYPASIEADVSAERLERFFVKGDHGYRISPDLRAVMVFTVQDVLADPPFSRIDLVSCRNLLIYLDQKAQARVISLLHFALRPGGRLLLGSAETIGKGNDRFELVSKADCVYRQVGLRRSGELGITSIGVDPGEKPTPAKDLTTVAPPHGGRARGALPAVGHRRLRACRRPHRRSRRVPFLSRTYRTLPARSGRGADARSGRHGPSRRTNDSEGGHTPCEPGEGARPRAGRQDQPRRQGSLVRHRHPPGHRRRPRAFVGLLRRGPDPRKASPPTPRGKKAGFG